MHRELLPTSSCGRLALDGVERQMGFPHSRDETSYIFGLLLGEADERPYYGPEPRILTLSSKE